MSFIDSHGFPAGLVLRVLGVPTSTYYDWRARQAAPSRRELDDAALLEQIVKIRGVNEFAAAYGSPRVWLELRSQGVRVGRTRVERVMREHGLQGAHLRRGWKHGSTWQNPAHRPAPDLLERDFTASAPNRRMGGRPDPHPHRGGRAVARVGARWVLQPGRGLGHRPSRHDGAGTHRARACPALTRCAGRGVDPPQRQGSSTRRCASLSAWSTQASPRQPGPQGTATTLSP